jgi:cytochrome c2
MKIYLSIMTILFIAMQFIRPATTNPHIEKSLELKAPKEVKEILKRSCYDCHSYETNWPIYSKIAPLSWLVVDHVNVGREVLNYSKWNKLDEKTQIKKLQRSLQTLRSGIMPLPSYLWLHKDAKISNKDKEILYNWLKDELEKRGISSY